MKRLLPKSEFAIKRDLVFSGFLAMLLAGIAISFLKCSSIVSDGGTETGDAKTVVFVYEIETCGKISTKITLPQDTTDYCSAVKLLWAYDSANNILQLLHTRCLFNCAAKLVVGVKDTNGSYAIFEYDTSTIKALCMCYRDIYYKIYNISASPVTILVGDKAVILDLHAVNGIEIIDTSGNWPCGPQHPHPTLPTPPYSPPQKPGNVKAVVVSPTSIKISWSNDTSSRSYEVYRANTASGIYDTLGTVTDSFFTDTAPAANVFYFYRIKASNQWGESPLSDAVMVRIIQPSNPNFSDNVLIAYRLTPEQEEQFSATDGQVSAFWGRWDALNASSLTADYAHIQSSDTAYAWNRCATSPFSGSSDAQLTIKAAFTGNGIYLLVDALDDQWVDSAGWGSDVVDIFFDQTSLDQVADPLNWFNPTQWALTFTSRRLQVPMGFSQAISGYTYGYYDDIEMRILDHYAQFGSPTFHGITMEIINIGPQHKQQEWFIPGIEWLQGQNMEVIQGARYSFAPGYHDCDADMPDCPNTIRWPNKYDPYHEPPDANTWGEIELGPSLP